MQISFSRDRVIIRRVVKIIQNQYSEPGGMRKKTQSLLGLSFARALHDLNLKTEVEHAPVYALIETRFLWHLIIAFSAVGLLVECGSHSTVAVKTCTGESACTLFERNAQPLHMVKLNKL